MDLIERPTELKTLAHLCSDALAEQQIARFVRNKLRREGQGAVGKSSAVDYHPGHRFTRCNRLRLIGPEASIDHTNEAYIVDHRGNQSQVIQALAMDRFHLAPLHRVVSPASIMALATPACFWTTQKHLTVERTMGARA